MVTLGLPSPRLAGDRGLWERSPAVFSANTCSWHFKVEFCIFSLLCSSAVFSLLALTWLSKCFSAVDLSTIQSSASLPSHFQPPLSFSSSSRSVYLNVSFCLLGYCAMCMYQEPTGSVRTPLGRSTWTPVLFPLPKQETEKLSVLLKVTVWSPFWSLGTHTLGDLGFPPPCVLLSLMPKP